MYSPGFNLYIQQNAVVAHMDKTVKWNAKHVKTQTVVVSMARALMDVLQDIADQKLDVQKDVCMEHVYLS